jgi:ribonuclease P protein component
MLHETHFSPFGPSSKAYARILGADAHTRRPRGDPRAPREGARAPRGRLSGARRYSRKQRLRGQDIDALLASGKGLRRAGVSVQTRPNALGCPRLGMIIPRRAVPRAVDRNRLRRLLREWFRLNQEQLGSRDILVRLTGEPGDFSSATIAQLLAKLP